MYLWSWRLILAFDNQTDPLNLLPRHRRCTAKYLPKSSFCGIRAVVDLHLVLSPCANNGFVHTKTDFFVRLPLELFSYFCKKILTRGGIVAKHHHGILVVSKCRQGGQAKGVSAWSKLPAPRVAI